MKSHKHYAEKYKQMFMNMAMEASTASVAKRKQVGCIIYTKDHLTLFGFNGMPSGSDNESCEDCDGKTKEDVVHAEHNAIKKAIECGVDLTDAVLYVTMQPCIDCSKMIEMVGVCKVFYKEEYRLTDGIDYLKQKGIEVEKI